jgi:hypothetical protein
VVLWKVLMQVEDRTSKKCLGEVAMPRREAPIAAGDDLRASGGTSGGQMTGLRMSQIL